MTESFLGMDQAVTQCQQGETQPGCQTRNYRAAAEEQCGCLPFSLKDYSQQEVAVCGAEQSACLLQIPLQTKECLAECQGMFVTNIVQQELNTAWSPAIRRALDQYDQYKHLHEEPVKFPQEILGRLVLIIPECRM